MEDLQLIALVRNGNTDAFGQIIERYQLPIAKYLYRLTGEYETAKDLDPHPNRIQFTIDIY